MGIKNGIDQECQAAEKGKRGPGSETDDPGCEENGDHIKDGNVYFGAVQVIDVGEKGDEDD